MSIRNFKDLRIDQKLGLFFLFAAFIILFNLIGVVYYMEKQDVDNAVINTSGRNRTLSQLVGLYAEQVRDGKPAKDDLKQTIELLDASLRVLKEGGIAPGFEDAVELPASPDHILPILQKVNAQWRPFKLSANVLMELPLTIDTVGLEQSYGPDSTVAVYQKTFTVPNPEIVKALEYLDANAEILMASLDGLVQAYVVESDLKQAKLLWFLLFLFALSVVLMITWVYVSNKFLKKPASLISDACANLAEGNIRFDASYDAEDEIGSSFKNLKKLVKNIRNASGFAESVGEGKFDTDFQPASENDRLGHALIKMRDKLQEVNHQDKKRNWATEGFAKFSDILRGDDGENQDISGVYDDIIQNLVKYIGANQGGIFVLNTTDKENPAMELKAAYAWSRKKYVEKEIAKGIGLIGQAWVEEEIIYLEDIPEDYVNISSGLGDSNPRSIIILPLKVNSNIYGVIEIASFKKYESYEIDFLKLLSETIASAISAARTSERTTDLLEKSQQQTEQLRAQEEEMRQNMEELSATQEEMQRKSVDIEFKISAMEQSGISSIEFDPSGMIINANDSFCRLMHYSQDELKGYHHSIFVDNDFAESKEYEDFWNGVITGTTEHGEFMRYNKLGNKVFLHGAYTVIRDASNKPVKVVKFVTDITQYVKEKEALKNENLKLKEKIAMN
ncbi:PAS domain S-box protein [Fulvivirga sp. M361]|uniref:GAF domain-containing protein n=1 Tax=Fulvivirga sp. M361 TaxID=2594266 RepID=UPI00117B086C|nr:GAF domain-containing protein [Fulvivirga sp. M361]TRX52674.1 PAS domain S-box protein [Fulvivirga sp. M361]